LNKIKAGVIGTGHMGHYHVNVYAEQLTNIEFHGIADIDEKRFRNYQKNIRLKDIRTIETC